MMDYRKFVEEETIEIRKTVGCDMAISALSGGVYSDYYIYQIDECSRMKGTWPVRAHATGGRHDRGDAVGQNFDTYTVEYTYPDGTKLFYYGRDMSRCHGEFAAMLTAQKAALARSRSPHLPSLGAGRPETLCRRVAGRSQSHEWNGGQLSACEASEVLVFFAARTKPCGSEK